MLILAASLAAGCTGPDPMSETVAVEAGTIEGTVSDDGSVFIFRGIPFAAPPVGDLRWRPPQPIESWTGTRDATTFGTSCIQNLAGSRPPWTEEFMVQNEIGEDCLYLNVWTAAEEIDEARPVLVYIHGGGFNEGSGAIDVYDGANLARKGAVVVTVNYRVGPLGFFAHPALTNESERDASGNYGLLDQVAALEWVRDNIAAFGGDPDRVTVAGQSAGAMSVVLLTASPLAEGLFHRAIIQSGPGALASFGVVSFDGSAGALEDAEAVGERFAAAKGAESLDALRSLSPEEVMRPVESAGPMRFSPVVDGWFLPDDVGALYASGDVNDVPTISGMNADEGSAFPGYGEITLEEFAAQAREQYGDRADEFLELYPAVTDAEAGAAQVAASRDRALTAMRHLAELRAETAETDLFLYYFARAIPWPAYPDFGAFHTGEVPYVFDNLNQLDRPWEEADREVANAASSYWMNFAENGDPNGPALPEWAPYGAGSGFMVFDDTTGMEELPSPERNAFMTSVMFSSGS